MIHWGGMYRKLEIKSLLMITNSETRTQGPLVLDARYSLVGQVITSRMKIMDTSCIVAARPWWSPKWYGRAAKKFHCTHPCTQYWILVRCRGAEVTLDR